MRLPLTPDYVFYDYHGITPDFLKSLGVRLLLTDLDYTLAPKRQREPDRELLDWVESLRGNDIAVSIISNNRSSVRVERFCGGLGIDYVGHAGKPSPRGLREAMRKHGAGAAETAMLGDKLLTDVLSARRCGVRSLMVEPKGGPCGAWNHVLHAMQEPFKRLSERDERNGKKTKRG